MESLGSRDRVAHPRVSLCGYEGSFTGPADDRRDRWGGRGDLLREECYSRQRMVEGRVFTSNPRRSVCLAPVRRNPGLGIVITVTRTSRPKSPGVPLTSVRTTLSNYPVSFVGRWTELRQFNLSRSRSETSRYWTLSASTETTKVFPRTVNVRDVTT